MRTKTLSLLFLPVAALWIGCSTPTEQAQAAGDDTAMDATHGPPPVTDQLEPYECGTMTRLHTYKSVFLGSQPTQADLEQAVKGGIKTVINLRHHAEMAGFDEAKAVADLGLAYHNLPWNGPDELTDEKFDASRMLLRTAQRPILLHCSSANRVGPIWLAYRVLDDGASYDVALNEAKIVGMKSPDYEAKARDYIQRMKRD